MMQDNQQDILTPEFVQPNGISRKKLLPTWIKIFMWIFLILGSLQPIVFIMGLLGRPAALALYGLETYEPISFLGILIMVLYTIKWITAFGLIREADWAIRIGLVDAVIGIVVCVLVMFYPAFDSSFRFSFRLELFALVPYLLRFNKIRPDWERMIKL
jgi:hypothetical protein